MTETASPRLSVATCRELGPADLTQTLAVFAAEPLVACPAAEHVAAYGVHRGSAEARLFTRGGAQHSLFFVSGSVLPLRGSASDMRAFSRMMVDRGFGPMSIHGRREHVVGVWEAAAPYWPAPREIRDCQHLMVLDGGLSSPTLGKQVRRATYRDFEAVLPAAAAMYREELGSDPLVVAAGEPFKSRVASLINARRTWIMYEGQTVVFKADVATKSPLAAQLQGVWVSPDHRGKGLGSRGIATVCEWILREGLVPTLVVNDSNMPALRTYSKVGFQKKIDYATVLAN